MLEGMPSRIPSDHLLSPLVGLRVSRYPRGYAVTSTPEGQEFHLHGNEVIKDQMLSTLYPLSSYEEGNFRETDRTCSVWLDGPVLFAIVPTDDASLHWRYHLPSSVVPASVRSAQGIGDVC
jgi:hypothetical protein